MPSLQGILFYWMLRLTKRRSPLLKGNLTVQQQRQIVEAQSKRFSAVPAGVELQPVKVQALDAEWLRTPGAAPDRAILFLHGGAFTMGSLIMGRGFAARIALITQIPVLSLNYRLAPEFPFPAGVEDTIQAYHWLIANGFTPEHVAFVGESGGGSVALEALVALRNTRDSSPGCAVALSPLVDLSLSSASIRERAREDPLLTPEWVQFHIAHYLGNCDAHAPEISPLFADSRGWPPLLIQVGEHELLYDDAVRFAEQASKVGSPITLEVGQGMWHGWQKFVPVPESKQAVDHLATFIHNHTLIH